MIWNRLSINFSFLIYITIALFGGFLIEALIFSLIILFHEIGHYLVLKKFNIRINSINLSIFGGNLEYDENQLNFFKEQLINITGILINIIIVIICKLIIIFNQEYVNNYLINIIINYNYLMIFFNLIPIYPLDGYRIIKSFLLLLYDEEYTYDILWYTSLLFITLLLIISYIIKNFGLFIITFFLLTKINNIRKYKTYSLLEQYKKLITR